MAGLRLLVQRVLWYFELSMVAWMRQMKAWDNFPRFPFSRQRERRSDDQVAVGFHRIGIETCNALQGGHIDVVVATTVNVDGHGRVATRF